jgi:AcrR family transcriptional regulator
MPALRPRERILVTATRLFESDGVTTVGVNRIIAEADVAPMTLYRQFGGKDALVAATLEAWGDRWLHHLGRELDERHGDDAQARYAGLWDVLEGWFGSDEFSGSFMTNAASELRSQPQHPAHKVVAGHRGELRQFLEDLAKAAEAGDPHRLAGDLLLLVDGSVAMAKADPGARPAADARRLAEAALAADRD